MSNTYQYSNESDYDKKVEIERTCFLSYYSKKMINSKYPSGGFVVIGGFGNPKNKILTPSGLIKLDNQRQGIKFYNLVYNAVLYKIDGYVGVGNNQYVAVLKSRMKWLIIGGVIIVLLGGALIWGGMQLSKGDILDVDAKDFIPPQGMNVNTDPEHIALPAFDVLNMEAGSDLLYVSLWNPPKNPCYFKYKITLKKGNILLYQSDLIAPGKAVSEVQLKHKIKAGKHDIIIDIESRSLKDKKVNYNNGSIDSVINALK